MLAVFNKTKTTSNGIESWVVVPGMGEDSLSIKVHAESLNRIDIELIPNLECQESDNPIANEIIDFIMNVSKGSKYTHRSFTYSSERDIDVNGITADLKNGVIKFDIPFKPIKTKTIKL